MPVRTKCAQPPQQGLTNDAGWINEPERDRSRAGSWLVQAWDHGTGAADDPGPGRAGRPGEMISPPRPAISVIDINQVTVKEIGFGE